MKTRLGPAGLTLLLLPLMSGLTAATSRIEKETLPAFFQKWPEEDVVYLILNLLGEARLGDHRSAGARSAWERSLGLNPDQPEVRKKLAALKIPDAR